MSYKPISNQYGFQFLNDLLKTLRLNQKAKHLKSKKGSYVLEQLLLLYNIYIAHYITITLSASHYKTIKIIQDTN
jgi:hypothetical protein